MDPPEISTNAPEAIRDESRDDERHRLVCPSETNSPPSLLVSPSVKLQCIVYLLCLISIGFITAVIETQEFIKSNCVILQTSLLNATEANNSTNTDSKRTFRPNEWVCWIVKNLYSLSAIGVIVYLHRGVFVQGKIPQVAMPHPRQQNQLIVVTNVIRYMKTTKAMGSYPSALFLVTFIIFSVFMCLSGGVEIVCGIIDAKVNPQTELPELFRRLLLVIFCVMQTRLFVIHYRHSVQWKLAATWLCGCHLLAVNIASWFFNVGLEVREIGCENELISRESFCDNHNITKFNVMLYPFGVEYYVMGAFMAFTLLANTGRLGHLLQIHINNLKDAADRTLSINLRSLLLAEPSPEAADRTVSEFNIIRRNSGSFALGLGFVVVTLIVSVFVTVKKHSIDQQEDDETLITKCTFYSALILLYSFGFVYTMKLLRSLRKPSVAQLGSTHLTDRLLLWLGVTGIIVYDSYNFWFTWTQIRKCDRPLLLTNNILLSVTCALNIVQSMAQVYALECALLRKFSTTRRRGKDGRALLNVLILLNSAEWIINTVCFTMFFPNKDMDNGLVLSVAAVPLQVFFRFHSAACIHEFKRHCQAPAHPVEAAGARESPRQPDLVLPFPTITSLMDSHYSEEYGGRAQGLLGVNRNVNPSNPLAQST